MTTLGSTLVLNEAYEPVGSVSWRKAVSKLQRGVAEIVTFYAGDLVYSHEFDLGDYDVARFGKLGRWFDEEIDAAGRVRVTMFRPAVIRETSKYRYRQNGPKFSRLNIFLRDDHECQYEGCPTTAREMGFGGVGLATREEMETFLKQVGRCSLPVAMLDFEHVFPKSRGGQDVWQNITTACKACNNFKDNRTPEEAGMVLRRKPFAPKWLPFKKARLKTPDEWRNWLYWNVEIG